MASTFTQASMTSTAGLIIASNTSRYRLTLKNIGLKTVFVGPDSSIVVTANSANGGFPIKAGKTLVLSDYNGDVYGICASTETSTIAVIGEVL